MKNRNNILRLSYSNYATYLRCPKLYMLQNRFPLPRISYADYEVGNFLHRYFYNIISNKLMYDFAHPESIWDKIKSGKEAIFARDFPDFENYEDMVEFYNGIKNSKIVVYRDEENYISKIERGMENARRLASRYLNSNQKIEQRMSVYEDRVNLIGVIDILTDTTVIDIKTGSRRDDEYREQIKFYVLLNYLKNLWIAQGEIVYLLSGELVPYRFSYNELERLRRNILIVAERILEGKFDKNPQSCSSLCPYYGICDLLD